jgi:hypothetical protein
VVIFNHLTGHDRGPTRVTKKRGSAPVPRSYAMGGGDPMMRSVCGASGRRFCCTRGRPKRTHQDVGRPAVVFDAMESTRFIIIFDG